MFEFFDRKFAEIFFGCGAVESVQHYISRSDFFKISDIGVELAFDDVAHSFTVAAAIEEECLNNTLAAEGFELGDELVPSATHIVVTVDELTHSGSAGVEFEHGVVETLDGRKYFGFFELSGISEEGGCGGRIVLIAHGYHHIYGLREVWIESWFAIAGKGEGVDLHVVVA